MQKYDGILVHKTRDELGPIEVVDDTLYRSLHFGSEPKQSSMSLSSPDSLVLSYTRAMTAALLFLPHPRRILLIGLGGGSLAKFLLRQLSECEIDVVEFRSQIHITAREWFALPDTPRLRIHIDDGAAYVREAARNTDNEYDLILVDAFEAMGIAESVCATTFFDDCHALLADQGMVSMNLWSQDRMGLEQILGHMRNSFGKEILRLPVGGKENVIALTGNLPGLKRRLKKLDVQAKLLEQQTGVEYPQFLRDLRKNNRSLFF